MTNHDVVGDGADGGSKLTALDKIIAEVTAEEKSSWLNIGKPWPQLFREDAALYLDDPDHTVADIRYEQEYPGITKELTKYLAGISNALAWDVCGCADASSLGARETHCLSLTLPEERTLDTETRKVFRGNLLRVNALQPLLQARNGRSPHVIFFNPGGAFSQKNMLEHRVRIGRLLLAHLRVSFKVLAPGGYIFIQYPFRYFRMESQHSEEFFKTVTSLLADSAEYRHIPNSKYMIVQKRSAYNQR